MLKESTMNMHASINSRAVHLKLILFSYSVLQICALQWIRKKSWKFFFLLIEFFRISLNDWLALGTMFCLQRISQKLIEFGNARRNRQINRPIANLNDQSPYDIRVDLDRVSKRQGRTRAGMNNILQYW